MVINDDDEEEQCGVCTSSCWYGKGKTFCASHRAAWNKSKAQADDAEEPSYISEMDDVLDVPPELVSEADKWTKTQADRDRSARLAMLEIDLARERAQNALLIDEASAMALDEAAAKAYFITAVVTLLATGLGGDRCHHVTDLCGSTASGSPESAFTSRRGSRLVQKANNFIRRRFPTRTLRHHCSYNVAVLHPKRGVTQSGTDRRYI
jgi:hypothetical protein